MDEDLTLDLNSAQPMAGDVPAARDTWGSFKLLARVGYGGFGEVYRAWDPDLEREVALKLLLPSAEGMPQSEEEYRAMLREARALASVRHPNIVPVYGIDRHDGRVGFWTDFVKGKTLSVLLGAQGPFGYREAALIGLDVTRALSAVHRAGILHRDIKAENVMREEGGRILLMDFGLSTLPQRQASIAGTPNYMAPELWRGEGASVASDIYAMGVLLFYLVTGEYPVRLGGLSATEATAALAHRRTLMDLRSDLPEPFLRTVSRAIEADPARRFASAGQLAEALAECLGTSASADARAPVEPAPAVHRRFSPWMRAGIAALFVLGGAAVKLPAVRGWLHLAPAVAKAGASPGINDEYVRAQALLSKSYSDKNVAEAVTIFEHILAEDNSFALAQAGLGTAYYKQYRNSNDGALLDKAKKEIDGALAKDKDLVPALATLALIETAEDHRDLALEHAQQALHLDSRSAEAYAALGEVYQSQGNMSDAIQAIQRASDLDPDNSMWLLRLGAYYKTTGDLQKAAAAWQRAVAADPENTFAYYDLGITNKQLDKLPEARSDFEKVLAVGPDEDTYRALGSVYQLQGNYDAAEKMDEQAIRLDVTDYQAWVNLGNVYAWSGKKHEQAMSAYGKAIALAEDRLRKTPNSIDLVIDLANLYASVGNEQKSLRLIRRALALAPDDPGVEYVAGYSYELLKDRTKAIPLIARSLARGGPTNEAQRSPELASLRSDPAFSLALAKAKTEAALDNKKKLD